MKSIILACLIGLFASCSHTVAYSEYRKPTPNKKVIEKIIVYEIGDPVPVGQIVLGRISLGDSGFSESCGYADAIALAKQKAREVGADAVQVTKVYPPNFISTCYRIEAVLLELKD